jgi:hypothetical protein
LYAFAWRLPNGMLILMSERLLNPNEQLIADIQTAIAPDVGHFEQLAATDGVQAFCNYDLRLMREFKYENLRKFLDDFKTDPEPQEFTGDEVAKCLAHANHRLDDFVGGIITSYCNRKKQILPVDQAGENAILAKVLSGGYSKVDEYMIWSRNNELGSEGIDTTEQKTFLPLTFVMLGARLKSSPYYDRIQDSLEQNTSQEEIDIYIDDTMQTACLAIQENKKITVPKDAPDAEKAFAASMNCLRTAYAMHEDRGFQERLMMQYINVFGVEDAKSIQDLHAVYEQFRTYFSELIGARYSTLDPQTAANVMHMAYKKSQKLFDDEERLAVSVKSTLDLLISIKSTHSLVDSIADGSVKYSQIKQAQMLLNKQPLSRPASEVVELQKDMDEWVNWEILPPGLLEDSDCLPQLDGPEQDPYDHERQIDWLRLLRLQNYAKGWKDAYFARTSIPNLPLDKQYYAVILPDTIDGRNVEHAVADHPETGNGMYVWRAEMGMERDAVRLTWREVMARPRMTARELGARCLYHTVNLEDNLLEYLTDPKPARRRYAKQ